MSNEKSFSFHLIDRSKHLCDGAMKAQERNKMETKISCKWNGNFSECLQRVPICSRKFLFDLIIPFSFIYH